MGPGIIRLLHLKSGAHALRAVLFTALAAAAFVPHQAFAAETATANTAAVVLTPGSIVKTADMDFGSIAVAATGGSVVLSPSATAACTASAPLVHSGACKAAAFSIRGKKNQRLRLRTADIASVTLTGPGGATMTMDTMEIAVSGLTEYTNGNGWDWTISDPSGNASFWVGAILHVGAAQAPGLYTGVLVVNVQFN